MKPLFKAVIYANFWVAFCFAVLTYGTLSYYQIPNACTYTCINFFSVLSAYQFHRLYWKEHSLHPISKRENWIITHKKGNNILTLFSFVALLFCMSTIHWDANTMIIGSFLLIIVIFYVVPVPLLKTPLRAIPFLKNVVICSAWTGMLLVPFLNENKPIFLLFILFVLLQTNAQLILFDGRDVARDAQSLKTIPQIIGIKHSKIVVFILIIVACSLITIETGFQPASLIILASNFLGLIVKPKQYDSLLAEFLWDLPFFISGISFYLL